MENRIFTFEEARELIEQVRERTGSADERLREMRARLESMPPHSSRAVKLNEWINTVINQWAEDILELGALPKGLWTVDFDSGDGYFFCWTLNEDDLTHFHMYEEGFRGRKPLTEMDQFDPSMLVN
jgi:hypothetical protein